MYIKLLDLVRRLTACAGMLAAVCRSAGSVAGGLIAGANYTSRSAGAGWVLFAAVRRNASQSRTMCEVTVRVWTRAIRLLGCHGSHAVC